MNVKMQEKFKTAKINNKNSIKNSQINNLHKNKIALKILNNMSNEHTIKH